MPKITFEYQITYWSNFYFFIQNLSSWHYSNLEIYNKKWREKLPKFTEAQEQQIRLFAEVRKSEPASNSIFEKAFYLSNDPMNEIGSELSEKDAKIVYKTFELFKESFDFLFKEELPKLEKWKNKLIQTNEEKYHKDIQKSLEIFYNEKVKKDKILKCYLLIAPVSHSGAFINDGFITQELSSLPIEFKEEIIGTIWHETIHAYFDKHYFMELVKDMGIKDDKKNIIKELTASSLLPLGILSNKFLKTELTDNIYRRFSFNKEQTERILKLTDEYIEKKLILDSAFINNLLEIIERGGPS